MCVGTGQEGEGSRQANGVHSFHGNCSDDQKEKYREAAKVRRSKEAENLKELENLIPVQKQAHQSEETHFDKISLIRFSIAYLKTREVINSGYFTSSMENDKLPRIDILSCLDGFTLVLSPDGDVIYTSHNISRYLGISQVDILGHPLSTYVHPCDHHHLQLLISGKGDTEGGDLVEIIARVKCLVTDRGRMVNLKQASYKSMKISGKIDQMKNSKHGGMTGGVFIGVARMVWPDGATTQPLNHSGVFSTKHGVDMRFSEANTWMCTVAGYSPHHLVGTSLYTLVHPQDSKMLQGAFSTLPAQGVCETAPYRLLCHGGGQVWVQTVARVVCKRGRQGQAVVCRHNQISLPLPAVCRHNQISELFDKEEVLSVDQLCHLRKSNERKRDDQFLERKNVRSILGETMNRKTCNISLAHNLETTENATTRGFQKTTKSSIPVIIDRRQHSDQEIIDQNMKGNTESQPKFVTSSLFENSETLCYNLTLGSGFSSQTNYPVILDKNDEITQMETYTQMRRGKEIPDDTDYLKNLQQLEESILMKDLEQLSPHSGYENITFEKDDGFEFLDFVNPAELAPDCQASIWTNFMSGTEKSQDEGRAQQQDEYGDDQDIARGFQGEPSKRKADDWWDNSFDENVKENNKVIKMKTYGDVYLQEACKDVTRTKQDQSSPSDWSGPSDPVLSCEAGDREGGMTRSLGGIFKKMRFESNMQ